MNNNNRRFSTSVAVRSLKNVVTSVVFCFFTMLPLHLLQSSNVIAASAAGDLNVSANVASNCLLTQVNPLSFGAYDSNGANNTTPLDVTSTFKISCVKNTSAAIVMNNGLYSSHGAGTTRAMKHIGSNTYMSYDIYTNSSRSTVWNSTTNIVNYTAATIAPATINVFGRVLAGQNLQSGTYQDTVTITVSF